MAVTALPNGRVFVMPPIPADIKDEALKKYLQDLTRSIEQQFGKQFDNIYEVAQNT